MTTPLVSISCITYNHAPYIRQCLNGFVMQKTNFPIEVLIHDDASMDGTADIIREYEQRYPEIIKPIYQTENQYSKGISISRIFNFPRVKGKYLALCEGDDYWTDPYKLQKQVDFMEANEDFSICFHPVKVYLQNEDRFVKELVNDVPSITDITALARENFIHTPSVLYRTNQQVISDFNEFPKLGIGDYPLHMLFAKYGKIKKLPDKMAVYRIHDSSTWSTKDANYTFTIWLKVLEALLIHFADNQNVCKILNKQYTSTLDVLIDQCISSNNPYFQLDLFNYIDKQFQNTYFLLVNTKINMVNKKINNLKAERDTLLNSRSWRFTKPLRDLGAFVRQHKTLLLIAKGLMSVIRKSTKSNTGNYLRWIKQNEPSGADLKLQRRHSFAYRPKISIVIPMYKTSLCYFKELLASVQAQTYDNWELCLVDGSPKRNKKIETFCAADKRIHYLFLGKNKGISGNTNEAIRLATGDYIAFMDHDDTLAPFALYENIKCINEQPDVEFIYSDEDNLIGNKRRNPFFKPDFAPDSWRSRNCVMHLVVMKQSLVDHLGGLRSEYDGAQDYDYVLRASEITKNIFHIRKILYHWRYLKTSTTNSSEATLIMGAKVLKAHMDRIGLKGSVIRNKATYYSIYDVIGNPSISIVIPSKDYVSTLKTCIDSILKCSTYDNYEIVIVENNSEKEETFAYYHELEKNPKIRVLYYPEKGFNYSKLINFGVKNCSSDYIVQLNNDAEIITPNWLELMLGFAQRPDVGAVGVRSFYPDKRIQYLGVYLNSFTMLGPCCIPHWYPYIEGIQNYIAVVGFCVMSNRNIFIKIGQMDESFTVECGDVDFCMELRKKNLLIVYNPLVELIHHESLSRGYDLLSPEKAIRRQCEIDYFCNKWAVEIRAGDPYVRMEYEKIGIY